MAGLLGVSRSALEKCERGAGEFDVARQKKLLDLCCQPPDAVVALLPAAIGQCCAPRALCRTPRLRLTALSEPAREKRPSIADWIGRNLDGIATGVLQEMLDDTALQKAIARREVLGVVSTTASVLATPEYDRIGVYRTTISYFFHEGTVYSDAISVLVSPDEWCGYTPIYIDEMGHDLFGDRGLLEAAMTTARPHRACTTKSPGDRPPVKQGRSQCG